MIGEGVLRIVHRHFPKVTKVIDAKESLEIEVNKADVSASKRKDMNECAMAKACKRVYHADGVIMARTTAYLIKGTLAVRFRVPASVTREITSFDRGSEFQPGTYFLAAVNKSSLEDEKKRNLDKEGGHKKSKGLRKYHLTQGIRAVLGSVDDKG